MNCVKRFLTAALLGVVALADSQTPVGEVESPKAAAVAVEYGLDPRLGALPTENLQFKTRQRKRAFKNCGGWVHGPTI